MYEVGMQPNWNEAPKGATHWLGRGKAYPWGRWKDGKYSFFIEPNQVWKTYDDQEVGERHFRGMPQRPQIQPKQQGEHKMFTAKQLKDTYPHKQMRLYIEATVADAAKRPAALGQLVKKFMANCEKQWPGAGVPQDIDSAFIWRDAPEGHDFWSEINDFRPKKKKEAIKPLVVDIKAQAFAHMAAGGIPVPEAPVAPKKEAKPAPKPAHKQVGWW